ncbi:hypothetical protein TNCV_1943561 [Trichonephila clavipes]|nr:hypothetical protein TNCV_1943561 [Trichonephila clavipes]
MPSFGTEIIRNHFIPTFEIKEQVSHKTGLLFPFTDGQHKLLQMYVMGDSKNVTLRDWDCPIRDAIQRTVSSPAPEFLRDGVLNKMAQNRTSRGALSQKLQQRRN